MTISESSAIITCCLTVGGVLIYVGRAVGRIEKAEEGIEVLFESKTKTEADISRMDKELTEVKTRQKDCKNCP